MRGLHARLTDEPRELWITENGSSMHLRYCRRPPTTLGAVFVGTYTAAVTLGQFCDDIEHAYLQFSGKLLVA